MTSLTIRQLRQRWPDAEKALEKEDEIVITRDGKAVAKLVRFSESPQKRPRFDADRHIARLMKTSGGKVFPSSDARLAAQRADRFGR
jgi:antitoxin (DNA-binding transcriptional repressor) of toxin-antitoxin stability system